MQKVKLKILRTAIGHDQDEGGATLPAKHYVEGEECEVGERLAKNFIAMGVAVEASVKKAEAQRLKEEGAPENKIEKNEGALTKIVKTRRQKKKE